jgi:hypothetical protein
MESACVAVGLPVHNDAEGVLRAVPAILNQTWRGDVRLIVVDDASTDGTANALAVLATQYAQLDVITNAERKGSRHACQQVLRSAGGGYLAWADARSVWLPRKLELQLAALLDEERRDPDAVLLCVARAQVAAGSAHVTPVTFSSDASGPATIVGKVEHFRAAGDFDPRAVGTPDFLLRFTARGGRLVVPPGEPPLVTTVLKNDGRPPTSRWRPREVGRGLTKQAARAIGRAVPTLQRLGILDVARRAGIVNALGVKGTGRTLYEEARATADAVWTSHDRADFTVKIERAADAAALLRVEQECREAGLLYTAEVALRRGLERFPDNPALRVRLIELLPLRRKWSQATECWVGRNEAERRLTGSLTYVRAARALRESGAVASAAAAAAEAATRWPSDWLVRNEVRISRAALVDWKRAVTVVGDSAEGPGTVHDLGFLVGVDGPLTGTVTVDQGQRCQVSIVVNGTAIATTDAAQIAHTDVRAVSLRCDDVLQYFGDGDVITIECDGRPLSIQGRGSRLEVTTGYESNFIDLQERIRDGYVFTKQGALKRGHTPDSKRQMLELFGEVSKILAGVLGYNAFPLYGNLLGAVRAHDFIAHDVGGFDMGYLSAYSNARDVRTEFIDICQVLLSHGYYLRVEPWSVYVRPTYRSRVYVDLNFAWFTTTGELQLSGGWRFAPVTGAAHFQTARTVPIFGQIVTVPGNAEEVLTQLYGPTWAVPDQGFVLDEGLQRADEYLLTPDEMLALERLDPDRVQPSALT